MNPARFFSSLALLALLFASSAQAQAVDWKLDPSHSTVAFTARHLGFAKVRGEFKKFSATVKADAKSGRLESVEASAETASVDTDSDKRDNHLRSDDFLNAQKFPTLTLKTKSIKWKGNKFTAQVALTLRDVTRTVTFEGELLGAHKVDFGNGPQMRAAYEAEATINRKQFGLNFAGVAEGLSIVGDEVQLHLTVEVSRPL